MPNKAFQRAALITVIATYVLVLIGGIVGATGSALSCPDWPVCSTTQLSGVGPILLEWAHRLGALTVTAAALTTLVIAWRSDRRRPVFMATTGALALLAIQIVLGGLTSLFAMPAGLAASHLGLALAFLATVLVLSLIPSEQRRPVIPAGKAWYLPLGAALAAYSTTVLGGFIRSIGAAGACGGWPLCNGQLLPPLTGPGLLDYTHRLLALATGILVVLAYLRAWRSQRYRPLVPTIATGGVLLFFLESSMGAFGSLYRLSAGMSVSALGVATMLFAAEVTLAVLTYQAPPLPAMAGAQEVIALPASSFDLSDVAGTIRAYFALWKPRIVLLLVITGYAGMWVAAGGVPSLSATVWAMLGLTLSCGGANSVNMWYDRDIDPLMRRTRGRPVPSGRVTPEQALAWGIFCGVSSFFLLSYAVNFMTALMALSGYLFYVFIYTMWLKRSTPQNIVIGGAAGAFPPLVGWAAVTGHMSWAAWIMFAIIFFWTPPHFWSLAMYKQDDYRAANIPMAPVVWGERPTKWQSLLYAVLLLPISMALYLTGVVGISYLIVATVMGLAFIGYCLISLREQLPAVKWARRTFTFSLAYLTVVFAAMVIAVK